MNPRRAHAGVTSWVSGLLLATGILGSTITGWSQTNLFSGRLTLESATASQGLLSVDLHRFLLESPYRPGRVYVRDAVPPPAPAVPIPRTEMTNETVAAAAFQDRWYQIEEERIDRIVQRIDEGGYGISSTRRTPNLLDRSIDVVFRPEPIQIGRVQMGFSPYTAIKRKNVFCLLNPVPFIVSW